MMHMQLCLQHCSLGGLKGGLKESLWQHVDALKYHEPRHNKQGCVQATPVSSLPLPACEYPEAP